LFVVCSWLFDKGEKTWKKNKSTTGCRVAIGIGKNKQPATNN
jgi:hypothetical protein